MDDTPTPERAVSKIDRRSGFNVGAGEVKEGDTAIYEGRECKVLTVYQDGDVQIEIPTFPPTYPTVKWRFVTPKPQADTPSERIVTMDNAIVRGMRKRPRPDEIAASNAEETGRKIRAIFARSEMDDTPTPERAECGQTIPRRKSMNKDPESWASVSVDAVCAGSPAQVRNVLAMALDDIKTLSMREAYWRQLAIAHCRRAVAEADQIEQRRS